MLKKSEITPELRQEIIEYTKTHSHYEAQQKYNVWADTIKYWIDPEMRRRIKQQEHEKYELVKDDPMYREKSRKKSETIRKTLANKAYMLRYRKENFETISATTKKHRLENIEHYKAKSLERYLKTGKARARELYHTDSVYKLKCNIREAIRRAIKYSGQIKDAPSVEYLGCSVDDFKKYIESKFKQGMTWDNHGRGTNCWHLDHILPLDLLNDAVDIALIKKLCHYTNYQPLWESENLQKQNKIPINECVLDQTISS